jgi:hypothetical protein
MVYKEILLFLLFALNDYFIIKSYVGYRKTYKQYWHYSKLAIVTYFGYLLHGLEIGLIGYFLLYYIIFEPTLNLLRGKNIFYVSRDGSKSDKLRSDIFGNKTFYFELLFIITAIIIYILL